MAMSRKTKTAYSRLKKRKKKLVVKSKRKFLRPIYNALFYNSKTRCDRQKQIAFL